MTAAPLAVGDPAPPFHAPALGGNPRYAFNTAAGRYIVMLFLRGDDTAAALSLVATNRALFDDARASFFGISSDPADITAYGLSQSLPGVRFLLDHDRAVATLYGVGAAGLWLLLDPMMRVLACAPLADGAAVLGHLAALPVLEEGAAPILILPRVLDPDLCRRLIACYEADGGADSGFMREVDGKTVVVVDHSHKRRADVAIDDEALRAEVRSAIQRRLVPEIAKAFQFTATRMERYIVACYDSSEGGYFRPHRDNTTRGTAHRRFAVTINLNAEDYDGGELRFPEFGTRSYRAPTGGAVVFSCSLLHEATPVANGRRYAFLPFLYDEPAARLREANNAFLGDGVTPYSPE